MQGDDWSKRIDNKPLIKEDIFTNMDNSDSLQHHNHENHKKHHLRPFIMAILSFACMYVLMYKMKTWNIVIGAICVFGLLGFYLAIRQQVAINDKEFLKSMIPHHAEQC
jgi:hypothetical protein